MDHFSGASVTHPVLACVEEIAAALKSVADVDPGFMTPADQRAALAELTGLESRVGELRLRVIAAAGPVAESEGCRDVAAWLVAHQRVDRPAAARDQRLASALTRRWTHTHTAVADGRVSLGQARVITRVLDRLATELDTTQAGTVLPAAERELVRLAAHHTPAELDRLGERILTVVAPQVAEDHERAALERAERAASAATRLRLQRRGDGSTDVRARVPDHVAARLKTYLEAYTSPRVAGGKNNTAGVVDPATGERIPYERLLGEAFCTLLESIDATQMPRHGAKPTTVVVTIDADRLRQALGSAVMADGTTISVGELRRQACAAGIIPAVLDGRSQVLDLGRKRRLFTGAQHLALAVTHPTCRAVGCTVPATWCEAHHAGDPWSHGGRTDLNEGALLCSWHHHRAHDTRYLTQRTPTGDFRFHRRI